MEDSANTASSSTEAAAVIMSTTTVKSSGSSSSKSNITLLEVQSAQLALRLQTELNGESPDESTSASIVEASATSLTSGLSSLLDGNAHSSPLHEAALHTQGAWSSSGPSAADILRAANPKGANTKQDAAQSSLQGRGIPTNESVSAVPLSASAVGVLVGMGIEESWAAAALKRCGGSDVARAVEFCFSHDMNTLAEEDARSVAAAPQDIDSDMAFAMALEQEERRTFEARRRATAAGMVTEGGAFGSKIKIGGSAAPVYAPTTASERWSVADAENTEEGGLRIEGDGDIGGGDSAEEVEEAGGGGEFDPVPGGGRRKGKMPLFRNAEGEIVSKHDAVLCGKMNARDASKLEGAGDLTAAGVLLSNRTYNSLKRDTRKKKEKGMTGGTRVETATRATQEGVMDAHTRLLVFKMINAGLLAEVHGMVKTGKEAHVYHATAPVDPEVPLGGSRGVALKIFKTTLNEFGNRASYVDGDPRYANMRFNKQSRRKMFTIWAKKEHRNLIRMHREGLPCPEPILQREHTLVMSFIGTDRWPAPQLRELDLSRANWRRCYAQVVELVRALYQRCRLVHADLSEYNVLYHDKVCHMIDVGQAVDTGHAKAREFLARDLAVVTSFFRRQGVDGCLDPSLAEEFVVGYRGPSEEHTSDGQGGDEGGAGKPLSGLRLLSELMEAPAEDLGAILQANCDAADPWADKVMRYGDDYAQDDDVDNGLESEGEEGEDDDEEARDEAAESYVATKQISAAAATGAAASSPLQENSVVVGKGGDVDCETSGIEEGWQLVTENSAQEDDADDDHGKTVKPRQTTTTAHGEGKGKVELGERERARTFDTKERLRAGLYS